MSTHTPGPWIVNAEQIFGNGYRIATVNMSGHWQQDRDLIAAAPDLLATCKQLASMAESGARAYNDNELRDLLIEIDNHARAAIAKAEDMS